MTVKRVLFPFFSLFLLYRSVELLRVLFQMDADRMGTGEMLFTAMIINLFITGVFAFVGFVFPTYRLLPASYYTISQPKTLALVVRIMGLKYFRTLLMLAYWGKAKNRKRYFNGTRQGIANLIEQSKRSEFGHLASFVSIMMVSVLLLWKGYDLLIAVTNLINIVGNFYPILLQRQHRMRIQRIVNE
ncbi:MAG: hypothetical protein K9J17_11220 [Flavobacteriales bacterium]|nr:hypothetical protein [Flavobacteriales bacterium]